jgi:hypothetical protein
MMSYFGHGSIKEDVLIGLKEIEEREGLSPAQMIALVISVLSYYTEEIAMAD